MSPQFPRENQIPPDWHERLARILSSPGVTQPPPISRQILWLAYLKYFARVCIAVLAPILWIMFPTLVGKDSRDVPAVVIILWLCSGLLCPVIIYLALRGSLKKGRRFQQMRRELRMNRHLNEASAPPILYLRSFAFDASSQNPMQVHDWIPISFGYLAGSEERLVDQVKKYASVLAIARPGETDLPFGAVRYYMEHDVWRERIAAIAPLCQMVLWASGSTDSLHWEIRHLIENLSPSRIVLLVHVHALNFTKRQREWQWTTFLSGCGGIFPKPLPADVEGIQFIAFGDDWEPQPIPLGRAAARFLKERLSAAS